MCDVMCGCVVLDYTVCFHEWERDVLFSFSFLCTVLAILHHGSLFAHTMDRFRRAVRAVCVRNERARRRDLHLKLRARVDIAYGFHIDRFGHVLNDSIVQRRDCQHCACAGHPGAVAREGCACT